jgi:hypothetical protein
MNRATNNQEKEEKTMTKYYLGVAKYFVSMGLAVVFMAGSETASVGTVFMRAHN